MLNLKGNKLTYFGHSAFSITTPSGEVALIDPWITTNPRCPDSHKKISRADAIFLSHAHSDHFGDTLDLARQHKPRIVAIFETAMWLRGKGFADQVCPMSKGGSQKIGAFDVTMTHAFHSNSLEDDSRLIYAGEPAGLIIRLPGGVTVYHAGDTAVFGDMKLIGQLYKPTVALLPIGDLFTMGPREAAQAVRLLGVKHVVPMHYATFPVLTGTPEKLREEAGDITGLSIHAMNPGDTL
jgi:L-ascorbate metabolism protein UlaG (beta-lactamase superfamily)